MEIVAVEFLYKYTVYSNQHYILPLTLMKTTDENVYLLVESINFDLTL